VIELRIASVVAGLAPAHAAILKNLIEI